MMWETSQRNSVITGGHEGPLKQTDLSADSWGLGCPARKMGQKRDKSESISAVTIPKDLSMTARGRFQQNADAVEAAGKELRGQRVGFHTSMKNGIQGCTSNHNEVGKWKHKPWALERPRREYCGFEISWMQTSIQAQRVLGQATTKVPL